MQAGIPMMAIGADNAKKKKKKKTADHGISLSRQLDSLEYRCQKNIHFLATVMYACMPIAGCIA